MVFEGFPQLLQTLRLRSEHERSTTMNTRNVIITAVLIASLGMLAFAQQQRQAGNPQGAAKGTPQVQAQLQQQDAVCPNGGEFVEDATRTQTRTRAHDPVSAPEGAPRQVQQQVRDPSTHE
jgi:hypothetical protein